MKLVGLMPVRNEDWVLGLSARVALQWCDALVIGLHFCTDNSAAICENLDAEFPGRIVLMAFHGRDWDEMKHRELLLRRARGEDATHIAMIDADEVISANLLQAREAVRTMKVVSVTGDMANVMLDSSLIRHHVAQLQPGQMLELPGYNLRGSLDRYHSNGIWGNRWFSVAFKDTPEAHWAGDKFHSRNPAGVRWGNWRPIKQGEGGVMHLWGASERRLIAKHALYKAVERIRFPQKPVAEIDRLYNLWRSPEDCLKMYPQQKQWGEPWEYARVADEWWHFNDIAPLGSLDIRGEVWQEAEVQRLVAEHGKEKFKGLDLFGVA